MRRAINFLTAGATVRTPQFGILIAVCLLLGGCGPSAEDLPPLEVQNGDETIISIVSGPHQLSGENLAQYPRGAKWQLKLPKGVVTQSRRVWYGEPGWSDTVYMELHWPSLESGEAHFGKTEKTPQGPNPTTYPFMTSEKKEYFVRLALKGGQLKGSFTDFIASYRAVCPKREDTGPFFMVAKQQSYCEYSRMVGEAMYRRKDGKVAPDQFLLPDSDVRHVVFMRGRGDYDGWYMELGLPVAKIADADEVYAAIVKFLDNHTLKRDPMRLVP